MALPVIVALAALIGSSAHAQALPESGHEPRVLFLAVEAGSTVSQSALDTVDEAIGTLPALATWARPSSSCDPAPIDELAGQTRCLASAECVRRVAAQCEADYLLAAHVEVARGAERVEVVLRVIDGHHGVATVEERVAADTGVGLERTMRRGIERIAGGGWLAGSLEVRGPASGLGVRLDGHDAGAAPVALSRLAAGYHQIELLAGGRVVYRGDVEVEAGVTSIVRASGAERADRYVVSVVRQDPNATDRAVAFAPSDVARRNPGTIALGSSSSDAQPLRATGVGLVVFEDRDPHRDVLLGRGRVSPTYHRGGVGASLRFDFQ